MANNFSIRIRTDGAEDFTKVFAEYAQWNKRQPSEVVNAKLYFVALNAMQTTKAADKGAIRKSLEAPATEYPDSSLARVITAVQMRKKGQKWTGKRFTAQIQKTINKAVSHANFLRSGWIPAIKKLDYWNKKGDIAFVKRFAPKKPKDVKTYGKEKGDVIAARPTPRCYGIIFNKIGQGKQDNNRVLSNLTDGLKLAVQKEVLSMRQYIERKYEEKLRKLNRTDTFK